MRSLSVSEGAKNAPIEGRNAREEKLTISCQTGLGLVLFFRKTSKPDWRFLWATRDQGFGTRDRELFNDSNDSGMAPQAIEIAQNGLGRSARSRLLIRRIDQTNSVLVPTATVMPEIDGNHRAVEPPSRQRPRKRS
jgi:hypothetical protein